MSTESPCVAAQFGADCDAGAGVRVHRLLAARPMLGAWAVALALALGIVLIHRVNRRAFIGFHGLTHSAITFSVLDSGVPPTNPLAAGLPLPYYWTYHVLLAGIVTALDCTPVAAAEMLNVAAVVLACLLFARVGRWLLGSVRAGIIAALLAFFAMNPFGPLILAYRALCGSTSLSIDAFTRSPTHPMLRAMFPNLDVRWAGNLFFFLQPSSRPLALAAGLLLAVLVCRALAEASVRRCAAIIVVTAFACAMQPIVGTGAAFGLSTGLVLVRRPQAWGVTDPRQIARIIAALGAGVVLAFPTFGPLLNGDLVGLPLEKDPVALALKGAGVFGVLGIVPVVLTVLAWRRGLLGRPQLRVLAVAGIVLLTTSWITFVPGHREHSFFNMGTCLLALPAAAACGIRRSNLPGRRQAEYRAASARTIRRIFACILPVACVMLLSFVYRRPITVGSDGVLLRDPQRPDRVALYTWITQYTPENAMLVFDTRQGPQQAFYGDESEIPAMTRRFLFIDVRAWFIPKTPQVPQRCAIADAIFDGQPLTARHRDVLAQIARPLYALCRTPKEDAALARTYGPSLVRIGDYALYQVTGAEQPAPDIVAARP